MADKTKKEAAKVATSSAGSATSGGKKNRPKHYQQKECPYCKVPVGNLPNHIKMKHKDQAEAEGFNQALRGINKDDLLGGHKQEVTPAAPGVTIYYCTNCRAKLRKGENPCWKCGESLKWEGID